ncbi:MAG: hypothetical protein IT310_02380 [Anaerolineales bacterium]|nr:hypothetical protein [Anaerolineales bacterium]
MKKTYALLFTLFQVIAIGYYGYVRIHNAERVKEPRSFGDTGEYLHNASLPVFSREFWTDLRAPGTALFWKTVGSDPERIFQLQLYFSIFAWAALAYCATQAVASNWLKPPLFVLALAFSLSRDIFMWDPFLGSESIALSFMALFLAAAFWLLREWKAYKLILLLCFAVGMTLTRDTFAYLLLMIALINLPVFGLGKARSKALALSFAFLLIFGISSRLAELGLRPYRAILMNTALRIYPSDEYTNYFREHGMPVDERLVEMSRNPEAGQKFAVNIALTFDADQAGYRQWAQESGHAQYLRFLWFFKADTFQKVFTETAGQSFYPDVFYYTATGYRPILKDARLAELLYPTRFGLFFFFIANLLAAFFIPIAWREQKSVWYIPLLMILLSYPQAVLVWAADPNDIARHSVSHNILMRLGVWFLLFFVLDFLIPKYSAQLRFLKPAKDSA